MNTMHRKSSLHTQRGVTLMELIVAMVIVGVLAAVAIPSYQSYTLKAHRTEAKSALLDMASLEERFFTTNQSYSSSVTDLGYPSGTTTIGSGYYQITTLNANGATAPSGTTPGTPATYTITVTSTGNQTKDTSCQTFTINSAGQQTASGTDTNATVNCWK